MNRNLKIYELPQAIYNVTPKKLKNKLIYIFERIDDEGKTIDELRVLKIG